MTLPVIDHVGIIVDDLDAAVERMRALFKSEPAYVMERPDAGLHIAANIIVEFLQYWGENADFARRVMGDTIGLNHLSARVDDIAESVADLKAAGFTPQEGFPRQGAHGQVVFFEKDPVAGLLFEVCQPDKDPDA